MNTIMTELSSIDHSDNKGPHLKVPNIIAISGGKGGVGKTCIAVNLSIALARLHQRVCLLDGDAGLANVNILLGLEPKFTLEHLISGQQTITEIMLPGPEGLTIIPGASGVSQCAEMDQQAQSSLINGLQQIESSFDWMIADTAAGISSTTIRMIDSAQHTLIVITPEPTSLTDAFSLLKVLRRNGYDRRVLVIVNMVSSSDQPQAIFRRFQAAVNKYIKLDTQYLGCVWMDESMRIAVANQKPVATLPENDPSCRRFFRLADSLISFCQDNPEPRQSMSYYWRNIIANHESQQLSKASSESRYTSKSPKDKVNQVSFESLLEFIQNATSIDSDKALALANALLERVPEYERDTVRPQQPDSANIDTETTKNMSPQEPEPVSSLSVTSELIPERPSLLSQMPSYKSNIRAPYYNEDRFGPQEALTDKIRNMDSDTSLEELLSQY